MTQLRRSDLTSRRFWQQLGSSTMAAVGLFATAAGVWDLLFPDTLPTGRPAAGGVLLVAAGFGLFRSWPQPVGQVFASPNVSIMVTSGDLFALEATHHLVIGMTDTFDTDTTTGIIASDSIQGQFLARCYGGDIPRLDHDIDQALATETSGTLVAKPGRTIRYPVGTVATLRRADRRYFCVAYSSMNDRNEARATVDGLLTSLSSLWGAVTAHANGGPIAMPVIGGGQSRLSQVLATPDAIRLQALSFWLACRQERRCAELRIVVRSVDYDALDHRELQAFLRSLTPA